MKIGLKTKSKATSLSKRTITTKRANCDKTRNKSKANTLVQNTKTIRKRRLMKFRPKLWIVNVLKSKPDKDKSPARN